MCEFFSIISDGKGKTMFFKPEDVVKIMCDGNKRNYDFNSHSSICHFFGIGGAIEDRVNKWEYDVEKKKLIKDTLNNNDDSTSVKETVEKFLSSNDVVFLRNLYGQNTGNRNTGDQNTGNRNTGDRNTGDRNTGDRNTGDQNTGNRNTGNRNTGNRNTGNWNTGNWNTGDQNTGYFCTGETEFKAFNTTTKLKRDEFLSKIPDFLFNVCPNIWIPGPNMTTKEKKDNPNFYVADGYLKTIPMKKAYKIAWDEASKEVREKVKQIPNFDAKIFKQITGITVK